MARHNIQLSLIDNNPYRDFDLDPLNKERVKDLCKSITDLGFWEGIRVRKRGDRYQLVFGHHRIAALRKLKWEKAWVDVVDYDDYQMVKAMGLENIQQRKGTSDYQDAIAGAIRVIGYNLLKHDAKSLKNSDVVKIFTSLKSAEISKGLFLKGNGIGKEALGGFFGGAISAGNINSALKVIRQTGKMTEYIKDAQLRIVNERAEILKKEAKARKAAEREKLAEEARNLAEAQDAAEEAVEKIEEKQEIKLHPGLGELFPVTHVFDSVASVLSSERALELIPVEEQVNAAEQLIEFFTEAMEKPRDALTGKEAKRLLNNYITNSLQWIKDETSEEVNDREKRRKTWEKLVRSVGAVIDAANELNAYIEEGHSGMFAESEFHEYASSMMTLISVTDTLDDSVSSGSVVSEQ